VFYGIQTLRKALPVVTNAKRIALPACSINDYPRFPYRGFLVDVGRHFFPVSYIKEIIDMLALHNINYFHWHLTDDQGWRIEIKKYPRLTETGSFRKETVTAYGSKSYDGVPVKGFYTQDEAREIIEYAAERYITVIPEIDMPGHMMAALASYPELGCTGGPYEVPCDFGVFKDVLCCGKAHTLQFAYDVLNEIMDVFPSKYIHIGGDECPKERWKECQSCQQKIKDLNLIDEAGHTKEDQLQTWFMGRMEELIKSRGRKMMGWDEILDGLPSKTITVMAWTSYDASVRSAKEGHATIVSPYNNFYFSNPHWNKLTGIKSMERVYDLEPVSDKLTADEAADVIGAQGCIWTEWVKDSVKMEYEMMPRIAGLSEVQWTVKDKKNLTDFMQRLPHMIDIYKMEGWNYKDDILNPPATDEKTKE
jgi:hexosaminidase